MQLAKQFWKIIAWSFASAWVATTSILIVFSLLEGWRLNTRPDLFPIGSENMTQMDVATSVSASMFAFWAFIGVLGIGAIFGIGITIYEWIKYKKFPLLPIDRVDVLRNDVDKHFTQIEKDVSDLKKKLAARRPHKPK
jgi:hypothetical protein